ncbi:MAG TPA: FixH family protein [Chthonomonadaceae bacterium]|nr:FixH family protein [Chthonomonadaceae bacterium]
MFPRNIYAFVALSVAMLLSGVSAWAQQAAPHPTQKAGKYAVELRIPAEGLYADEETDIEFRVTDTSQDDPVQGAPPVVKAKVSARLTMPSMPSMPAQTPKTHSEGVPGDYGVVVYFPHGGEYHLDLNITPPDDKPFTVSFQVPVDDADAVKKRPPKPRPYTLEVVPAPKTVRAGQPVDLTILIRSRDTRQPVTDFDTVHEKKIHFIIVSRDLSFFAHEHPELGLDGKFALRFTFPTGGEYRLFADVAPHGAGSQVLMQPLKVEGMPAAGVPTLKPAVLMEPVGGVRVTLQTDTAALPSGRTIPLAFALQDAKTNEPITDLEPYLGAMAHLILIHQDGATFVHCHPDETEPASGQNGALTFQARFPKPGAYRGWLQFQRRGQVLTATFVVAAREREGKP